MREDPQLNQQGGHIILERLNTRARPGHPAVSIRMDCVLVFFVIFKRCPAVRLWLIGFWLYSPQLFTRRGVRPHQYTAVYTHTGQPRQVELALYAQTNGNLIIRWSSISYQIKCSVCQISKWQPCIPTIHKPIHTYPYLQKNNNTHIPIPTRNKLIQTYPYIQDTN